MAVIRLGQVEYLNCLPVYHALEEGLLDFRGSLVKGPPASLNRLFLEGRLDVTPLSSIEYARNTGKCIILPGISISADGRVDSILLFSRCPATELEGKRIAVTTSSATSVALLRILLEHYYQVQAEFVSLEPDLKKMIREGDGALLIGDDAMLARRMVLEEGLNLLVTDLGEAWKQFTGERMVYAVWAVREEFAREHPGEVDDLVKLLAASKDLGMSDLGTVIRKARRRTGLPVPILEDYFQTIRYDFDEKYRRSLCVFYDYAYKSGIIEQRARLRVWGEGDEQR
ncbi:MAG: menaquinone biosynthesis protein [Peptococcaceae bacterium]|nr:menaquinone biosynthesis protein [Peptococcaceae bacterium]